MSAFEQFMIFWLACQLIGPVVIGMYAGAFGAVYINHTRKVKREYRPTSRTS